MRLFISIAILVLMGVGCAVGPDYRSSKYHSAPAFSELNPAVNTNEPVAEWWKEFHDPELTRLVNMALQSNLDLQVASMRIRESRWQRNIAAADLFPEVNADGSYVHSHGSKNVVLPLGGSGQGGDSSGGAGKMTRGRDDAGSSSGSQNVSPTAPSIEPSPFGQGGLPGATTDLYQLGFDASWEIDVFGGKRRQVEAASYALAAAGESRHFLQVSLAAETARDYLELRGTQERLRIAQKNLADENDVLTLTRSKRISGLSADFDVIRAAAQVAATASTIAPLESNVRRLVHTLSVLVGKEPNAILAELAAPQPLPVAPPEIPVGLPSQLLTRRADIRQAERQIAAANARIGVAKADLFPKFALVASAGLDSSQPGNLFNWESRYFLISPTATWRIFDAGRILSNIQLQRAEEQETVLQYRGAILKALQEVEDALVTYATERIRRGRLSEQFYQNQQALELAKKSYHQGLTDFLTVLDAERTLLSSQDQLATSEISITTDLVALYKALGGGWKN